MLHGADGGWSGRFGFPAPLQEVQQDTGSECEAAIDVVSQMQGHDAGGEGPAAFVGDEAVEFCAHGDSSGNRRQCEGPVAGDKERGGDGHQGENGDTGNALGDGQVEMVRERGGTEDEPCPGQGAAPDVGMKPRSDGPVFQVLDLDGGVECDAVAGAAETMPKGDVFNARTDVALVEASDAKKDFAADRSAAGPKCGSILTRMLMHEVVQEVLVLRDKTWAVGFVVVRAD